MTKKELFQQALWAGLVKNSTEFWKEVYSFARSEKLDPVPAGEKWIAMKLEEPKQEEFNYHEEVKLSYDFYQEQEDEFNRPRFAKQGKDARSVSKKWDDCPICTTKMTEDGTTYWCPNCELTAEEAYSIA